MTNGSEISKKDICFSQMSFFEVSWGLFIIILCYMTN